MFKNIELTEINANQVFRSIWVLIGSIFVMGLVKFLFSPEFSLERFDGIVIFYHCIQFVFFGWPLWGSFLVVFCLIEYLTLGKSSSKKTVRNLLIAEVILLSVCILAGMMVNEFRLEGLLICFVFVIAQTFRWAFLKFKGRMYNFVNEPKK